MALKLKDILGVPPRDFYTADIGDAATIQKLEQIYAVMQPETMRRTAALAETDYFQHNTAAARSIPTLLPLADLQKGVKNTAAGLKKYGRTLRDSILDSREYLLHGMTAEKYAKQKETATKQLNTFMARYGINDLDTAKLFYQFSGYVYDRFGEADKLGSPIIQEFLSQIFEMRFQYDIGAEYGLTGGSLDELKRKGTNKIDTLFKNWINAYATDAAGTWKAMNRLATEAYGGKSFTRHLNAELRKLGK